MAENVLDNIIKRKRGYVKKVIIVTFPHLNNLKVLNGDNKNLSNEMGKTVQN